MDELNSLERQRRKTVITTEERRLIDEAVAEGRVTRIPTGASVFARKYIWEERPRDVGQLVEVVSNSYRRPGHYWRQQINQGHRLGKALKRYRM